MKLSDFEIVLFDLDGTIYYGSKLIPGANEAITYFRDNNKKVYFTTNNSTMTRAQVYEKLVEIGVDCSIDEVITSGYIAALTALNNGFEDVYIFGSDNLIKEFVDMGVSVKQDSEAENLLIGYNPNMTYEELTDALQVALHAKCIMACNRERIFPGEDARLMPGCGAMTAPIEWCANRECDFVIGKPNTLMVELLSQMNRVRQSKFLVIGDTYESDIVMANVAGCKSILISDIPVKYTTTLKSIAEIPNYFE